MIRLRDVRRDDLEGLSELCLRSKAVWGYDDAFLAACRVELTLQPAEMQSTHLQLAASEMTPVGLVQIKVADEDADLLKLFVEPDRLKSGIGRLLLGWAIARAKSLHARRMIVEADPDAVPFYQRMGAQLAGFAPSGSIADRKRPRLILDF
jgi:GNAT superfamily N-acetyltransferase